MSYKDPRQMGISDMVGQTFYKVSGDRSSDTLEFISATHRFTFSHHQDCCENVYIEDICGDLSDLEGSPLLQAEEVDSDVPDYHECNEYYSETWTFYKFATIKGAVTVRWLGTSNGYYSESVNLDVVEV